MEKKSKKPKRAPNDFDFCPKHSVFYKSCGCKRKKRGKENTKGEGDSAD